MIIWVVADSWFVQVTVVPFGTVAVCGLKAKLWMAMVNVGETVVWFAGVVVIWGVGTVVITAVADAVTVGAGTVVITVVVIVVTAGMGAAVITVVADVVETCAGAGVTWVGAGAGPCRGDTHPAISTENRIATPAIKDHLPDKPVIIRMPHDMMIISVR